MSFQASSYSGLNIALVNEGEPTDLELAQAQASTAKSQQWSDIATAAGLFSSSLIQTVGAIKVQKSAQEHAAEMAEKDAALYGLKTQAAQAEGVLAQTAHAMQGLATTRTLIILGGVVLTLGIIAATIVALRRGGEEEE